MARLHCDASLSSARHARRRQCVARRRASRRRSLTCCRSTLCTSRRCRVVWLLNMLSLSRLSPDLFFDRLTLIDRLQSAKASALRLPGCVGDGASTARVRSTLAAPGRASWSVLTWHAPATNASLLTTEDDRYIDACTSTYCRCFVSFDANTGSSCVWAV